jgi:MEMO1 family protein
MSATPIRQPAVAGRFYPRDREALRADVEVFLAQRREKKVRALGCIAPHAGYMYSGHVAGAVFAAIEIPELCVVICPNHTGAGVPFSMMSVGAWETPLGSVPIASDFAATLKKLCPLLEEDSAAHRSEHAVEVELPFLQVCQPKLKFVPIALGTRNFEALEQLGVTLAEAITSQREAVLIVASSDMNHYESDAITRVKDESAIDPILQLDPRALYNVVMEESVSMCGFGPAVVLLTAAKKLGGRSAELVKYATSGDISGDRDTVVGYAGIIVPAP